MHTCTLQSLFFSLQVYRAGFLLIMPALLTSRSAYQCIPSHTWTAHHTAQFGTTRGTWEKSLNWKRKKNVVLFREKTEHSTMLQLHLTLLHLPAKIFFPLLALYSVLTKFYFLISWCRSTRCPCKIPCPVGNHCRNSLWMKLCGL